MDKNEDFVISEYFYTVWRRKWTFLFVALLILAAGVAAIARIPIIYRSTGVILVEQQEIPTQWVNSTVSSFADERIQSIGQRVLSTDNIANIIEKFNPFPNQKDVLPLGQLVELVRSNFNIRTVEARIRDRVSGRGNSGTVAFQISYDNPDPTVARDVASELVSLYLEENLKARTQAAADTRRFLESEADRLEQELANLEEQISDFKEKNIGVLPEHQDINIRTFERVEQQIADIDRTLGSLDERIVIIETSIDSATRLLRAGRASSGSGEVVNPELQRLEELRAEYRSLQTRYSAYHPDLIRIRREIGLLETQLSGASSVAGGSDLLELEAQLREARNRYSDEHPEVLRLLREVAASADASNTAVGVASENTTQFEPISEDSALIALRTDLQSAISEQRSLRARKADLTRKLAELDTRINKAPEVERGYRSLIRDHENIQQKYNDIRAKQNSARVAESLESEQKGERFTLLEAPRLANYPHSPNHKKLFLLAFGFAIVGGLGAVFGIELFDGRIRNIRSLETVSGVPVLATIGVIENKKDRTLHLSKIAIIILIFGFLIGAGIYLMYKYRISPGSLHPRALLDAARDWITSDADKKEILESLRNWINQFRQLGS